MHVLCRSFKLVFNILILSSRNNSFFENTFSQIVFFKNDINSGYTQILGNGKSTKAAKKSQKYTNTQKYLSTWFKIEVLAPIRVVVVTFFCFRNNEHIIPH